MKKIQYLMAVVALLLSSCGTVRDFYYFQDLNDGDLTKVAGAVQTVKVKPHDKLSVIISCKDPELSAMYNLAVSTTRVGQTTGTSYGNYGQVSLYTVDEAGFIELPIVGKVEVAGLTRAEVAARVKDSVTQSSQGVKDAAVTVDFVNMYVGVLGEVKSAGIVPIDRDQFTVLDAIEKAGDLTQYGNRKNVKVMRREGEYVRTYELDMTNFAKLCESPAFMLQQDDVIYVEPNSVRARQSTAAGNTLLTPSFWMSVLSVAISVAVLIK